MKLVPPGLTSERALRRGLPALLAVAGVLAGATPLRAHEDDPRIGACARVSASALSRCFLAVGESLRDCYAGGGSFCAEANPDVTQALDRLEQRIRSTCEESHVLEDLGFGSALTLDGFADRLREACAGEAQSLASRSFGGPQGAVLASAEKGSSCLDEVHYDAARLVVKAFRSRSRCLITTSAPSRAS